MRRYAPLLAGLAALLLAVVSWFLLFQPRRAEQAELRLEIEQIQALQQQVRLEIARLEEIERNELAFRATLARLEELIPNGAAQPTAIRHFQLTADAAGVDILSVTFGEPEAVVDAPATGVPGTVLGSISMTMTIEGGYFQAADFFRRVESTMPRAVLVAAVNMGASSLGFPTLSTTWSGSLFALIPAPEAEGEAVVPGGTPSPEPTPTPTPTPAPAPPPTEPATQAASGQAAKDGA